MKILTVLLIMTIGSISAFAEVHVPVGASSIPVAESTTLERGFNMLKLSPMYLEIKSVIERVETREQELLQNLAQATTDAQVADIIEQIESLAVDREVDILKIQIRYARLDNRFDRERRLRHKLTAVLEACGDHQAAPGSTQALQ